MLHHSFQCLIHSQLPNDLTDRILIGALGSSLYIFDIKSGQLLSTWHLDSLIQNVGTSRVASTQPKPSQDVTGDVQPEEPPVKRPKIATTPAVSDSSSAEIVVEGGVDFKNSFSNAIIKLAVSSDGRYVVVVTAEDKCVRVLEFSTTGILSQVSERVMPKRPCAITLTPDDSYVLCADKFGDVYSLPLLGQTYKADANKEVDDNGDNTNGKVKAFVPSATKLNVHTKRNRRALEQQQQNFVHKKPEKKSLNFEHRLLLGHVSLLTDLAYTSLPLDSLKSREYILTSDRDEHIRVSRGIPQTHIIEGFCLGHSHFVSKICLVNDKPEWLISGGGDDFILLWDWTTFRIMQRIDLRPVMEGFRQSSRDTAVDFGKSQPSKELDLDSENSGNIAVSQIRTMKTHKGVVRIIVVLERVPALFFFAIDSETQVISESPDFFRTPGNVIDFAVIPDSSSVVYSVDTIHCSGSTDIVGDEMLAPKVSAGFYSFDGGAPSAGMTKMLSAMDKSAQDRPFIWQTNAAKGKSLTELLYGLEGLRKRGGAADNDIDDAD